MRITNKIMQNNSLSNINTNKILQDKLNTQMTTEKKINRPSDDPVIAIRALRLRSTLSELTQYHDKNASDAASWLEVTETALNTTVDILSDMKSQCNDGTNDSLSTENRKAILDSLKALRDEIYQAGDTDVAGRNVFTGYRTGTKLTFQEDTTQPYRITEQLNKDSMDTITYINTGKLPQVNGGNYDQADFDITEQDITKKGVTRIRLGYDGLDQSYTPQIADVNGDPVTFTKADGTTGNITVTTKSLYGTDNPYETLGDDDAFFVPETGELLLGKNVSAAINAKSDNPLTQDVDEGEVRISYEKSEWQEGDLNPVHYYACSEMEGTAGARTEKLAYNGGWEEGQFENREMEYDVGFNQKLRVNTCANECFNQSIGRDVDELISVVEQVDAMEEVWTAMQKATEADPDDTEAAERFAAADKALTMLKDKMQKSFSAGITKFDKHLDRANQAVTACGTRDARLDLIKERLSDQLTTFDNLASENENADTTKIAIELSSAELSYEAALLATGKIVQTTLLNFL